MELQHRLTPVIHVIAAICALFYAWGIFHTRFVTSGLQFIAPLLVLMLIHVLWLAYIGQIKPGFSNVLFKRVFHTAIGLFAVIFGIEIIAPQPAQASDWGGLADLLMIVTCLAILLVILAIAGLFMYLIFKIALTIWRYFFPRGSGPENRLFDFASVGIAFGALITASLEGVPAFYAFPAQQKASMVYEVDAAPAKVWKAMEHATSPEFPLPDLLHLFPRPTDVVTDQGTQLGALRQVKFSGREGIGILSLKVTERTDQLAVFTVQSDTSPFANWLTFQDITYRVMPNGTGSRLEVSLGFERRLAPAWFFYPVMQGTGKLAMGVLARDVKKRAES